MTKGEIGSRKTAKRLENRESKMVDFPEIYQPVHDAVGRKKIIRRSHHSLSRFSLVTSAPN